MSHRQAKRLNQIKQLNSSLGIKDETLEVEEDDEEVEEEEMDGLKKKNTFVFDLSETSESESDESSQEESCQEEDQQEDENESIQTEKEFIKKEKESIKKEKECLEKESMDFDEILNDFISSSVSSTENNDSILVHKLWIVDPKGMDADKETMKRFGIQKKTDESETIHGNHRRSSRRGPRRKFMVFPESSWLHCPTFAGGGIHIVRVPQKDLGSTKDARWEKNCIFVEIQVSDAYDKIQNQFHQLQQTHDPNQIALLASRNPFHIESIYQLSELYQQTSQMDKSFALVKRCVYIYDAAWNVRMDLGQGNLRIDIANNSWNRMYFQVLFKYMFQSGRKGCCRTAFQVAKFLLSLDPYLDPMGVLLCIDYYALCVRECQFVIDLYESSTKVYDPRQQEEGESTVKVLPNLKFSVALAWFFLEKETEAINCAIEAFRHYPVALHMLLKACDVDLSSGSWGVISNHPYFQSQNEDSLTMHLVSIFVERNATLWKMDAVLNFVLEACQCLILSLEDASSQPDCHSSSVQPDYNSSSGQPDWSPPCLRKYQQCRLSDYSDEITTMPDEPNLRDDIFEWREEEEEVVHQLHPMHEGDATNTDLLDADGNPLLLFFQSILPWNRVRGTENLEN